MSCLLNLPKEYGYYYDLLRLMKAGKDLTIDEINEIGGRISGKTTTIQQFIALIGYHQIPNVGVICMRHLVGDKEQLVKDFQETYTAFEVPYKYNQNHSIMMAYNQPIRFLGINTTKKGMPAKKSGLAKFGNVRYIIVFFEERFEFEETDVRAMVEAIRSISPNNKNVQTLYINACNPWAINSPYISYCSKYMTWDINILKTTGSQIKIVDIPMEGGKIKRALFHYTNWRIIKDLLPESEIKKILDTWNYDKRRAATTDWGLPGYEQGAIYTHLLNNLGNAIYQEHLYVVGGMDYGWGREKTSGKTVCYFMGYTPNNGIDIYGEYVHSNYEKARGPDAIYEEIVRFYYEQMKEYTRRIGWPDTAVNLTVRVDNMAVGVIEGLNNVVRKYGIKWLKFVKCVKFPVNDRIEITLSAMYKHQIRLAPDVKLLKSEFELAFYEESKSGVQKRAKVNDHAINAFEYGIETFMYKIAKENQLSRLSLKGERMW